MMEGVEMVGMASAYGDLNSRKRDTAWLDSIVDSYSIVGTWESLSAIA